MSGKLIILGLGDAFAPIVSLAKTIPDFDDVQVCDLVTADGYTFSLPDMTAYPKEEWRAFVALDERGLNMARTQAVAELKLRGYKLATLVAPDAVLGADAVVGENCLVGRGAYIGDGTRVVFNSYISDRALVGNHCVINKSCFVGKGVTIDNKVVLADFVTLGTGVHLQEGTQVGKSSELRHRKSYGGTIADKTFYLDIFPNPVEIISPL
ncbi:MAG: hypothetical protein JO126_09120 [Alphaproteobacteria bacterium]|nr:hypothetical protein [Alphaproteobacteria bacterium]MBV8549602.1 hypothetical protein [Alphaproteobacteria bacterium]